MAPIPPQKRGPNTESPRRKRRLIPVLASMIGAIVTAAALVWAALALPLGLVTDHWNPLRPLVLDAPVTPVTKMKLWTLEAAQCQALLAEAGNPTLSDRRDSAECHVTDAVRAQRMSVARLKPMNTKCSMAVRLFLWERNSLQVAARRHLGTSVDQIAHYSSYSCRRMRTSRGTSGRMSEHATANAIDISGFSLADGRFVDLRAAWDGDGPDAMFLREARDGLCKWFRAVLSPDYNTLHADHFHVDQGRWPVCR